MWPLAPGEHPDLPRLHCELHPGTPAVNGKKPTPAVRPYARVQWSPIKVLQTGSPARLHADALELTVLAEHLEHAQQTFNPNPDQLQLEEG